MKEYKGNMSISCSFSDGLKELGLLIGNGKKILLFNCSDIRLLMIIDTWIRENKTIDIVVGQSIEETLTDGRVKFVPKKTMSDIMSIYRMYDFSDKISVISEPDQYGSLFNYVKTGILTEKEMVDALLYKI